MNKQRGYVHIVVQFTYDASEQKGLLPFPTDKKQACQVIRGHTVVDNTALAKLGYTVDDVYCEDVFGDIWTVESRHNPEGEE